MPYVGRKYCYYSLFVQTIFYTRKTEKRVKITGKHVKHQRR